MKPALFLVLLVATCLPAIAAEPATSPAETLAWLKSVDGQLKKPRLTDLTLEQLPVLAEVTLGGHRKSDGKHLDIPAVEFRHLAGLPGLRRLVLWENDGVTDEALTHIGKLTHLRELELADAPITSDGLKHVRGLKSLTFLSVGWTKDVGDAALPHIISLPELEVLVLSGTKVTDEGLGGLAKIKQLKEVRLAAIPQVTDKGLNHLHSCASLRTVIVNKKTGVTPQGIAEFRKQRPDCQIVVR